MGYLADGFTWGFRPDFLKAIRSFDRQLGRTDGNMNLACREFLQGLHYEIRLSRSWNQDSGSIIPHSMDLPFHWRVRLI
jgi:hypothetical protein